ncbi:DUF7255 family protein [Bacteroides cellulosilyticus]|uniref:Uncharacterized protein n=1 Tax=Bacteroides cellulosilyticus TaxID=246787 RepID=A0A642PW33_9BACE|nr:hypothetical protein [Bacteroides cellulosilyticus]KAA5416517.1 hypothetical protein F2Y81_15270 [Bacteroides cellulosilyticus]
MGERQALLKSLAEDIYDNSSIKTPKISIFEIEYSGLISEVERIYYALGGTSEQVPLNYGAWDIQLKDFYIELDEERHFNRYRFETLTSSIYEDYSNFSVSNYREYCLMNEEQCLKSASWGNNWRTNSSDKLFIVSGDNGDLSKNGSSRWRQRAFYDFIKDLISVVRKVPVLRVSIYDNYNGNTVNEMLIKKDIHNLRAFLKHLEKRI